MSALYMYSGIFFNLKKECRSSTYYNKDEPWIHHAKWNKPNTKERILSASIYVNYPLLSKPEGWKGDWRPPEAEREGNRVSVQPVSYYRAGWCKRVRDEGEGWLHVIWSTSCLRTAYCMYGTATFHVLHILAYFKKIALHTGPTAEVFGILWWMFLEINMLKPFMWV